MYKRQSQEHILVEREESDNRHVALRKALGVLNERERRIFEARRLVDDPVTLEDLSTEFNICLLYTSAGFGKSG